MGKITEVEYIEVPDGVIDVDKICLNIALTTLMDVDDSFIDKATESMENMFEIKNKVLSERETTPGKQYREFYSALGGRKLIIVG